MPSGSCRPVYHMNHREPSFPGNTRTTGFDTAPPSHASPPPAASTRPAPVATEGGAHLARTLARRCCTCSTGLTLALACVCLAQRCVPVAVYSTYQLCSRSVRSRASLLTCWIVYKLLQVATVMAGRSAPREPDVASAVCTISCSTAGAQYRKALGMGR